MWSNPVDLLGVTGARSQLEGVGPSREAGKCYTPYLLFIFKLL